MPPALVPKVTPFASENPKVWKVNEPLEADAAWLLWEVSALWLAVMILPALEPNVMPLALLNPRVEKRKEPFEAEAATGWVLCWVIPS